MTINLKNIRFLMFLYLIFLRLHFFHFLKFCLLFAASSSFGRESWTKESRTRSYVKRISFFAKNYINIYIIINVIMESVSSMSDDATSKLSKRVLYICNVCVCLCVCVCVCVCMSIWIYALMSGIIRLHGDRVVKRSSKDYWFPDKRLGTVNRNSWTGRLTCTYWDSIPRGCLAISFDSACRRTVHSPSSVLLLGTGTGKSRKQTDNRPYSFLKEKCKLL